MAHLEEIDFTGTHRLIPEKYSNEQVVLETLRLPEHVLSDLNELDGATSEWKRAEAGRSAALGPHELVFGVPEAAIVNASFTHPGPEGARFSSAKRGAWYAGLKFDTSVAEVAFHRRRFLQNVRNEKFHGRQAFSYVDFLADFRGKFHHLDPDEQRSCSQAEPIPACYRAPQRLAEKLLFEGSLGIVYQSVRHSSGTCIACFRPALVLNPRRDARCQVSLDTGSDSIEVSAHSTAAPV